MFSGGGKPEYDLYKFTVPEYVLTGEIAHEQVPGGVAPKFPVLVFVNSKSGGQLGAPLISSFRSLLNPSQVYDLFEHEPGDVLRSVLGNMEKLMTKGDKVAGEIRANLRLIVAGGDGTAGWLLGIIGDLKLADPPPLATIPLGTGNNLPFSFGWGKKNPGTDKTAAFQLLLKVADARPIPVDSWHIILRFTAPSDSGQDLDPVQLPHSLHSFKRVVPGDELHEEGHLIFRGGFWNYLSMGMDAQVSYGFHKKRESHPERFKNQLLNQLQYATLSCTQGWFCATCVHPASRNINHTAKLKIAKHNGEWQELQISDRIRSILFLNLPSFSGGLDPWGDPSDKKSIKRGLTAPFVNDGLLEIIGFRDGWHGLASLTPKGHGTRLAQAHKVRIEFKAEAVEHAFVRMDGEPWMQHLPSQDKNTIIEITHLGQAQVLALGNCMAKPVREEIIQRLDSQTGKEAVGEEEDQFDSDRIAKVDAMAESGDEDSECRRKFGAAQTFKR